MILQADAQGFKANTPPGVAWGLVGGVERLLGPLVLPFVFPSGMILTWESSWPTVGHPGVGSLGVGSLDTLRARTVVRDPSSPFEVRWRDDRLIATITLTPWERAPARIDYRELVASLGRMLPQHYFDPDLAASKPVRGYLGDLAAGAAKAGDDIEFLFASAMTARKHIAKYGTPVAYPKPTEESRAAFASSSQPRPTFHVSSDGGITTLRMDSFLDDATTDAAFGEALATKPAGLILDLRTCPGMELGSIRAAAWLGAQDLSMGVYYSAAHRATMRTKPPRLPDERPVTGGDVAQRVLARDGFVNPVVMPHPGAFHGPLAILTSRRTSSTAETLTAVLVRTGRARSFGEPTAGRPMLDKEIDLGQGWAVRLAAYDYALPDGSPLPAGGVRPSVAVDKAKAPAAARAFLLREIERGAVAITSGETP